MTIGSFLTGWSFLNIRSILTGWSFLIIGSFLITGSFLIKGLIIIEFLGVVLLVVTMVEVVDGSAKVVVLRVEGTVLWVVGGNVVVAMNLLVDGSDVVVVASRLVVRLVDLGSSINLSVVFTKGFVLNVNG